MQCGITLVVPLQGSDECVVFVIPAGFALIGLVLVGVALFASLPEKLRGALQRAIPFGRLAKPEEVAQAILFLGGGRSDYMTGQVLSVSGGLTMAG